MSKAIYSRAYRNGMGVEELREFLDAHGHKCDICSREADYSINHAGGLVVDHDHSCCPPMTPRIAFADRPKQLCGKCARGLLCIRCNTLLGQVGDNPDLLLRAIEYLTQARDAK